MKPLDPARFAVRLLLAVGISMGMFFASAGLASAGKGNTVKASVAVTSEVLNSLGLSISPSCVKLKLVKADRKWGYYKMTSPPPAGCPYVGDGTATLVMKSNGRWIALPVMSNAQCGEVRAAVSVAGGSRKVVRVLAKGWGC